MKRALFPVICILVLGAVAQAQNVQFKNPPELSKPNGYTHVVVVNRGKLAFISGQVGLNSKGEISSDFAAQAKQSFANLKTALAAAGATPADIVKLNYYVVGLNPDKLAALRVTRDSVIDTQHPPASTLAGVQSLFRDDVQIEIDAEAVIP
jgi:enamine deaminase RidA (YjgF/YER057c/UK114 family)